MEDFGETLPSLQPILDASSAAVVASTTKPAPSVSLSRKPIEPIDVEYLRVEGKRRWLKGPEIYRLLHTFRQSGIAPLDSIVQRPGPGTWFLYTPGIKVRQDGYSYPKKDRNGYPVMQESHVHLQLYNRRVISCYYSRVEDPPPTCRGLTRRLYWLVGPGEEGEGEGEHAQPAVAHTGNGPKGVAFVHYLDTDALACEEECVEGGSGGGGGGSTSSATLSRRRSRATSASGTQAHEQQRAAATWAVDGRSRKRKGDARGSSEEGVLPVPVPALGGGHSSGGTKTRGAQTEGQPVKRQATDSTLPLPVLPPPPPPGRVDLSWGLWEEEGGGFPYSGDPSLPPIGLPYTQAGCGMDISMDIDMDMEMGVGLHLATGTDSGRLTPPHPATALPPLQPARPAGSSVYSGVGEDRETAEGVSDALSGPDCSDGSSVCSGSSDGGSDSSGSWSSDGVSLQNATEKLLDRVATQLAELDGGGTVLSGAGEVPGRVAASVGSTVEGRAASRLRSTGTGGGSESRGSSSRHTRKERRRRKEKGRQAADTSTALVLGSDPSSGSTLLHVAAGSGKVFWVRTLLAMGADPWVTDRAGRTPLACAQGAAVQAMLAAQPQLSSGSGGDMRRRASASAQTDGEGNGGSTGAGGSATATPALVRSRSSSAASSHTPLHGSTPRPGNVPSLPGTGEGLGGAMSPTDRAVLLDAFSALSLKDRCAVAVALHMDDRQQQAGTGASSSGASAVPSPAASSHAEGLARSHSAGSHLSMPSQEDAASVRLALTLMSARDMLELEVEAKRIQSGVRAWLARRNYRHIKAAAKTLQGAVRRMLAKRQQGASNDAHPSTHSPSLLPSGLPPLSDSSEGQLPTLPPTRPTVPSGSTGASLPPSFLPVVHEGFAGAEEEEEEEGRVPSMPVTGAGAFHILDERGRQSLPPLPPLPVVPGALPAAALPTGLPSLSSLAKGQVPLSLPPVPPVPVPAMAAHAHAHGHGQGHRGTALEQGQEVTPAAWDEELEWSRQQAAAAAVIARTLKRFYGTAVEGGTSTSGSGSGSGRESLPPSH